MEKFSKIDKKKREIDKGENILFDNNYLKIIEYENWNILEERDLVVCIVYFVEDNKFLIRQEYIPTFKYVEGSEYFITVLSGGIEDGEDPKEALFRELEEEAGIVINPDFMNIEEYKPLYINKGHVNKYHPFIIPLSKNDYKQVVAIGDGSEAERLSKSAKVDTRYIDSLDVSDTITGYMLLLLKNYLNT